jgi:hypothetical protein
LSQTQPNLEPKSNQPLSAKQVEKVEPKSNQPLSAKQVEKVEPNPT